MAARGGVLGPVVLIGHVLAEAVVSHGPCSFPEQLRLSAIAHDDTMADLEFAGPVRAGTSRTRIGEQLGPQPAVFDVCCDCGVIDATPAQVGPRGFREGERVCLSRNLSAGSAFRLATHGFRSSGYAQVEVAGRPPRSNSAGPHHGRQVAVLFLELWGRRRQKGTFGGEEATIQGSSSPSTQGSRGEQLPNKP